MPKNIAIIGSTGSIGRQTLAVVRAHPGHFKVIALACHENIQLLEEQIKKFRPEFVAVYNKEKADALSKKLAKIAFRKMPKIFSGETGLMKIATSAKIRKIVFAGNGLTALSALLQAIKRHKEIALATKELIVAHGRAIMALARKCSVTIVPVDSEHSAIFQCLQGEDPDNIEKIILTCSGGPFYGRDKTSLANVTLAQALRHPTWVMGRKISVDSATLMNKGFEIIEAMHLFGLKEDQIEILIHPESVIHSMVQFKDGSIKAQLSPPDMRLPITYALAYPGRIKTAWPRLDLQKLSKLTFRKPDHTVFEGPALALAALKKGGRFPARLTRANDEAVQKFLKSEIGFLDIYSHIRKAITSAETQS